MLLVKKVFIILGILLLCACSSKKKQAKSVNTGDSKDFDNIFSLKQDKVIEIEIDEFTPFRSRNSQYVITKTDTLLIWENRSINALEFYSLVTKRLVKRLKIDKAGSTGMDGSLAGFEYMSEDSILVVNGRRYEFFLVNAEGEAYKKYKTYPGTESNISVPIVYDYKPIMLAPPFAYIVCMPDGDYRKKDWWNGNLLLKLNIETGEYSYLHKGPEKYYDKVYGAFFSHHAMTMNDSGQMVISYPMDSEIEVYDLMENNSNWFYGGSQHFHSIADWHMPGSNEAERFYIESDSYREILYDPWRQIYYRFAYRGVDYYDQNNMRVNWNFKIPSVVILDKEFNKIGEHDLPKNTYYTRNTFVSPKGLYISINHDENKNADENKLAFQLFKPVDIQ